MAAAPACRKPTTQYPERSRAGRKDGGAVALLLAGVPERSSIRDADRRDKQPRTRTKQFRRFLRRSAIRFYRDRPPETGRVVRECLACCGCEWEGLCSIRDAPAPTRRREAMRSGSERPWRISSRKRI